MEEVYLQRRKRGFFGWMFLLIFIGWNVLMLSWLFNYGAFVGEHIDGSTSEWERSGAEVGGGIGIIMILMVWSFGAVITGLFALLTRGSQTVVTKA